MCAGADASRCSAAGLQVLRERSDADLDHFRAAAVMKMCRPERLEQTTVRRRRWAELAEVPELVAPFKRAIYQTVAQEFKPFALRTGA